jgi:hypothetical protein
MLAILRTAAPAGNSGRSRLPSSGATTATRLSPETAQASPVTFDWSGVGMTTGAFADELAGVLADRGLQVRHASMCPAVEEVAGLVTWRHEGSGAGSANT